MWPHQHALSEDVSSSFQPPTPIFCDNECTIGLAHDVVRKKQSKSVDLRWDWLRDHVA
jgi:hypothetical protein